MSRTGNWQAGEEVALSNGGYRLTELRKIERVTPSGIAVIGARRFGPNGNERGAGPSLLDGGHIYRVTPHQRAAILADLKHDRYRRNAARAVDRAAALTRINSGADLPILKRIAQSLAWLDQP